MDQILQVGPRIALGKYSPLGERDPSKCCEIYTQGRPHGIQAVRLGGQSFKNHQQHRCESPKQWRRVGWVLVASIFA